MAASPQTSPPPLLRSHHEIGTLRIAFHVSSHNPEMLVALHGKRFVPTLVNMAQSRIASMLLPPPDMGDRQPLHKRCELTVVLRPHEQVPVVRHHGVRTNPHRRLFESVAQNLLERLIIRSLLEQLHSRHAAIQDVKHHSARSDPRCSWHRRTLTENPLDCQYRTCPAFCPSRFLSLRFLSRTENPLDCQYRTCPAFCPLSRFLSPEQKTP